MRSPTTSSSPTTGEGSRIRRALGSVLLAAACLFVLPAPPPSSALENGLARTPPMGWNSWYAFRCRVTEDEVLANAQALVGSGLARAGYNYVNVDGCWEGARRSRNGSLQANPATFPSGMAELGRRLHGMGLRFGIYTSAGPTICSHVQPGSFGHYNQDLRTFASWKVDYVKVDWCSAPPGRSHPIAVYRKIAQAAARSGRRMIVAVSIPAHEPWRWGASSGNLWRIGDDLDGTWKSVMRVLDTDASLWPYAGPGRWNDADVLQVGNGRLSETEARAHFSLWSMLASPLLAGVDLRAIAPAALSTLANPDVVAVDQDPAGKQARRVERAQGHEAWSRPLADHSRALLFLNRTGRDLSYTAHLRSLAGSGVYRVRDLWSGHEAVVDAATPITFSIPPHGAIMWRVSRQGG